MSEDRPKPRYGEYATPEEQAEAIRERLGTDPSAQADTGDGSNASSPLSPASPVGAPSAASRPTPAPAANAIDRFITLFLLGMGVVSLLQGIGGYLNLGALIDAGYASFGAALRATDIGHYTTTGLTGALGWVLTIVHTVALTLAVYYSLRRLRARRISWWIPVIAAVVVFLATMIVMFVLLTLDPAFQAMVAAGA